MHNALLALPEMPFRNALPELPFQNTLSQNDLPHDAPPKYALPQKPLLVTQSTQKAFPLALHFWHAVIGRTNPEEIFCNQIHQNICQVVNI